MLLALLFQFTYPGVPVIYYGDEIGITGEKDPDCRKTMVWDETHWDREIYGTVKNLIHLRRTRSVLQRGRYEPAVITPDGLFGYWRTLPDARMLVLFNRTEQLQHISLPVAADFRGNWKTVYPHAGASTLVGERWNLALPPRMGMIWEWNGR